mgnify:CR=1 FL=1
MRILFTRSRLKILTKYICFSWHVESHKIHGTIFDLPQGHLKKRYTFHHWHKENGSLTERCLKSQSNSRDFNQQIELYMLRRILSGILKKLSLLHKANFKVNLHRRVFQVSLGIFYIFSNLLMNPSHTYRQIFWSTLYRASQHSPKAGIPTIIKILPIQSKASLAQ